MRADIGTASGRFTSVALVRGGALSLVGAVVSAIAGFLVTFIVSRMLGADAASVFAVLVSSYMVLLVSGKLGADTALVHVIPRLVDTQRAGAVRACVHAALLPVLVVNIALSTLLITSAPGVVSVFLPTTDPNVAIPAVVVCAIALPLGTATLLLLAATRGLGRIAALVGVENILKPILRVMLILAIVASGHGVRAAVFAWALPTLVGLAMSVVAYARAAPVADSTADRRELRKAVWSFARPRSVAAVLEIVGLQIGVLLLGALGAPSAAGIYSAAARVIMVGVLLQQSLRLVVAPQASRLLARGKQASVERLHRNSAVWIVLFSWPLYLVVMAWPEQVMGAFGLEFRTGALALVVLCVGALVNLFTGNVQTIVLMSGRANVNMGIMAVSVLLNTTLCVLLIPRHGPTGAAIARSAAVMWENVVSAAYSRRALGVRTVSGPLVLVSGLAAACFLLPAVAFHWLGITSVPAIIVQVLISGLFYVGAVYTMRRSLLVDQLVGLVRTSFRQRRPALNGGI